MCAFGLRLGECLWKQRWGGGGLIRANRVLFASPERHREARSYLARASAAVSHTLHAPLPGREGGGVKG